MLYDKQNTMIDFKEITLEAKEEIQRFTLTGEERNCDLSVANLCSWSFLYHTHYAVKDGFLLLRFLINDAPVYMMPVGKGNFCPLLDALAEDALRLGSPFRLMGISEEGKEMIERERPECFSFTEERDFFDYIYLRSDLSTLTGKKYQPKRNHLNRFRHANPDYEYRELTPGLVPECLKLEESWCRANGCSEERALADERRSMTYALTHLEELGVTGGVLHADGRIVAFTYGAPINHNTWDVCVEKADTEVEGSYAMINYEYANRIAESYIYINREEDLGLEGLRKAKLSYQPHLLLKKYTAVII